MGNAKRPSQRRRRGQPDSKRWHEYERRKRALLKQLGRGDITRDDYERAISRILDDLNL